MLLENTNNHCKSLPINHVGIIMDGNRRWAKSNGLKNIDGHKKGAKTAKAIITKAIDLNIKYLTLFAFSSENWKRKSEEINDLISLLRFFLKKEIKNLINAGIKLSTIGELSIFPKDIKKKLEESITLSKKNNKMNLIIAINYGSRQEITNSFKKVIKNIYEKKIKLDDICENTISSNLYTAGLPDPDLIIRTGGDFRLSNFLLWQSAYSEFVFIKKTWPELTIKDFILAINEFHARERRFGGS